MGVWTRVRSLWENDQALQTVADELSFGFKKMREQYPSRDTNAWLAWSLASRNGWTQRDKEELLLIAAPCSITTEDQATALLALDVVSVDYPELQRVVDDKTPELFLPVDFAIKNGTFLKLWKQTNPWTDENYPSIEQELKRGFLSGANSKPVDKVQITCPHCRTQLRVPGFTGGKKIRCPGCKSLFFVDP